MVPQGSSVYENNSKTGRGDMRCEVGNWIPVAKDRVAQ